ncbi:hypothetical protein Nepgr_029213 [Nepenthes gracilis]|uniref:C2 NT-type domain-containing protein n=1 Tax=Nepenthes gracilis TaxID=150966 RepID=A0AAD3TD69_NEPGR|nr:hypothetical protein Nepgr_029213 [Nepenthes gracilis]
MAAKFSDKRDSNPQLLEELEALSQSMYQSHISAARRTASLALPRNSVPPVSSVDEVEADPVNSEDKSTIKPRSRRMSLSPWRSRPKHDDRNEAKDHAKSQKQKELTLFDTGAATVGKKGIWNWKPIRALSHIAMQKLSCLFSVEVVAVQGLPASMNGLRLSVCVRKTETKDGAVHTMPSRVSQGAADFEETLFVKCHVYCTPGSGTQLRFEPRPFLIYVFALDAGELDFGRSSVDLSRLIQESIAKNAQGTRIRQWDTGFDLAGKAKGGELVLKLGFQIIDKDVGAGIYNQVEGLRANKASSSIARKQSKTSFSIPSPKMTSGAGIWTPSRAGTTVNIQAMDHLNLDDPAAAPSPPAVQKLKVPESKIEDLDLPEFEVVDKGIEIQDVEDHKERDLTVKTEVLSESSEDVKEMVHDQFHLTRLSELDSIARQIKALESMMGEENSSRTYETDYQRLDDEEETVTREFLQRLEDKEASESKNYQFDMPPLKIEGNKETSDAESKVFMPDLGKGLGCVVQTRTGGYLSAMNPLEVSMMRKDTPKLAMQMSKPFVLTQQKFTSGLELFQRMAAVGLEELSSAIVSLMPIEELMGKTAEQTAFEGVASAIINGRNKEGASSSAARTIAAVKKMETAMNTGRRERITTGIWMVGEGPLTADELLPFSTQKIEAMSIDALKIQADMAEEDAPFDISPLSGKDQNDPLASAIPLEEWTKNQNVEVSNTKPDDPAAIILVAVVQLRDPLRRYEAVGGPVIALIQAMHANSEGEEFKEAKEKFKVVSLHIGGMKVQTGQRKNAWDAEKQRLTAMQWLVAYGMGKAGKKGKTPHVKGQDLLWSISSRVMADMWLKSIRNPDVKFTK